MIDEPRQCCDVTPPLTANNIPLDSTPSDLPPVTNGSIEVRHWCADWARRWCGAGAERPPRATILEVCVSGVLSFVGIFALSLIHYVVSRSCSPCTELDTAQIVGSFGASAVLLFAAPKVCIWGSLCFEAFGNGRHHSRSPVTYWEVISSLRLSGWEHTRESRSRWILWWWQHQSPSVSASC